LKTQKLADGTVYKRISALAQFSEYLRNKVGMMRFIPINPARVPLRKIQCFFNRKVLRLYREKNWDICSTWLPITQLINHLRAYAILQFYVATRRRRVVIIGLCGNSIEIKDGRFFIKAKG
jgi:hypothetical protein